LGKRRKIKGRSRKIETYSKSLLIILVPETTLKESLKKEKVRIWILSIVINLKIKW
jgi:hypothetical protein